MGLQMAKKGKEYKEMNIEVVLKEISHNLTVFRHLSKSKKFNNISNCLTRCLCGITLEVSYCPETEVFHGKYHNNRLFIGKDEDVIEIKSIINEKVNGTFEIKYR